MWRFRERPPGAATLPGVSEAALETRCPQMSKSTRSRPSCQTTSHSWAVADQATAEKTSFEVAWGEAEAWKAAVTGAPFASSSRAHTSQEPLPACWSQLTR